MAVDLDEADGLAACLILERGKLLEARQRIEQLEAALRKLLGFLEDGTLCRDISRDHEPGWAMRQLPLVQTLTEVKALLHPPGEGKG